MKKTLKERGFSMVELMVVVAIIAIIAGITVPWIMNWLHFYRLRSASQEVASELQTARMQAVMRTANAGVALVIVDANSYRFVNFDLLASSDADLRAQALGRLKSLPQAIVFDAAAAGGTPTDAVRFSRLGGSCWRGSAGCTTPTTLPACPEDQCDDDNTTSVWMAGVPAVAPDPPMTVVGLRDTRYNITRQVEVLGSGRITETQ